jgi:hypothetical protein
MNEHLMTNYLVVLEDYLKYHPKETYKQLTCCHSWVFLPLDRGCKCARCGKFVPEIDSLLDKEYPDATS